MTGIHFLELAACIGDYEARTQLKDAWDAIDPPSEIEVTAFLERYLGCEGPFSKDERLEGRARLMALMAEQSLGHRLDFEEEDFWEDEEFDLSGKWVDAGDTDAPGEAPPHVLTLDEGAEFQFTWCGAEWDQTSDHLVPRNSGLWISDWCGDPIRLGQGKMSPANNLVALCSLPTDKGPVMFGNDGVSVYIRRPPGVSAVGLSLGGSDYTLDPVTGAAGIERIVGLTVSGMRAFIQGHGSNSSSLSWKD